MISQRSTLKEPLLQQQLVGGSSAQVDRKLIEERNADLKDIETELGALKEVVVDVNHITHESGEKLDRVAENIHRVEVNVERGVNQLQDVSTRAPLCFPPPHIPHFLI